MIRLPLIIVIFFMTGCCDRISSDADELKAKHKKCEAGETCIIVDMYEVAGGNNCLGPFQCPSSMNEKRIDKFKKEANELAEDYENCRDCVQASCLSMDGYIPFCNEETGLCDAEMPE